jgi:thioesterase domain-containing protein
MPNDLDRILPLQPHGLRPPLFCVHAVSGSAYSYAGLARQLGPDQPVYGFEAPGFDNDRPPVRSLTDLADEYTAILLEFHPVRSYRLLGWSLGGLVAFEVAKRLTAAGARAETLIMVDAGLPVPSPLPPEREVLRRFIRDMMGRSDEAPPEVEAIFRGLPLELTPETAFAAVAEAGVLPAEMDAALLAGQYAVFRALLEGFYSIDITGPYTGPAVHILAEQSPAHDMRWCPVIPRVREHTVTGSTHHSIWTGTNLVTLTGIVRSVLTGADDHDADESEQTHDADRA